MFNRGYGITQNSILPDFVFLCFLIFAFKLYHFVTQDNNAISIKLPSLREKMSALRKKSLVRLTPGVTKNEPRAIFKYPWGLSPKPNV